MDTVQVSIAITLKMACADSDGYMNHQSWDITRFRTRLETRPRLSFTSKDLMGNNEAQCREDRSELFTEKRGAETPNTTRKVGLMKKGITSYIEAENPKQLASFDTHYIDHSL